MNDLSLIISVTAIHIVALVSPGPDFFMALKNSITYSRKTGIYTAVGFGIGISIHILYSITGLAFIISKSEFLFTIIKYLGASYLFYIGIKSLLNSPEKVSLDKQTHLNDISPLQAIKIGFITNILNPKVGLFFISFFPQFINQNHATGPLPFLYLGATFLIIGTIWSIFIAFAASFMTNTLRNNKTAENLLYKLSGTVFIGFGLKIAFSRG